MDAISEVLNSVKLNGALFFSAEFSAPWGFCAPAPHTLAPLLSPGAKHLVLYHLLVSGNALVRLAGQTVGLEPGDIVIFPHGESHVVCSMQGAIPPFTNYGIVERIQSRDLSPLRAGGGGDVSRFVCGYMAWDPHLSRPILGGLPPVFKVNIRTDASGQWLEQSVLHLLEEARSGGVGSEAMLAKISEALFVEILRRYVAGLPHSQTGWLAGARDPIVGRSLSLLHGRVSRAWTTADLASQVGVSRSALVERFTRFLAEPPMTYLTRWRLQLAARSLQRTARGVGEIGAEVGYESEAAFNRAFKRAFGKPPGHYRADLQRGAGMPDRATAPTAPAVRAAPEVRVAPEVRAAPAVPVPRRRGRAAAPSLLPDMSEESDTL